MLTLPATHTQRLPYSGLPQHKGTHSQVPVLPWQSEFWLSPQNLKERVQTRCGTILAEQVWV